MALQCTPMTVEFSGKIWYWRGPAPFFFVTVPSRHFRAIHELSRAVTYGWGMIPVNASIGDMEWTTAMFPKDGSYVLPLKMAVRKAAGVGEGDNVKVALTIAKDGGF